MDTTIAAAIQKAYSLIRAGRHAEAQAILVPIVRADANLAEAWYMLGLALTDREKSLYAFQQVIRIDPSSQRAQEQIEKLLGEKDNPFPVQSPFITTPEPERKSSPEPFTQPIPPAAPVISPLPSIPHYTTPIEVLQASAAPVVPAPVESQKKEPEILQKKRNPAPILIGAAVVVVMLVLLAMVILSNRGVADAILPLSRSTVTPTRPIPSETPNVTPTATSYVPVFHADACQFGIPLGTRVRCGVVRVPQDRSKSLSEDLIDLPVVIYQSSKFDADAVLFLQGGPGVESINWSLATFQDYVTPILKDHDMIFFDPRGTGRSKPNLDCPELNATYLDAYYQNRSQDDAFQDFLDAWNRCHERFVAKGVNPAVFNTVESAADVHDIVIALGYKQVDLLGISYGTRLGLTVMRDYPEIVHAAVLDSVVPLEAKMFNRRATDTQYVLNKLFADCASNSRCNGVYPDLAFIFNQLIERFDKKPATIQVTDPSTGFLATAKVNGVDMLSAIVEGMHNSELVPVIPKAIYDIRSDDYTFLSYALGARGGSYNTTGLGAYFSTICPEQVFVTTADQLDTDLNVTPLIKQFALTGLFGSTKNLFQLCNAWDAKPANPDDLLPVTANIPTLVISGQYDPTTPSTTGEMVANDLPNHYFYTIPGMGHGATLGNSCSASIMHAFLKAPEKEPNSACLTAKPFEFFMPYDGKQPVDLVELADSTNGVQGLIPADWKKKLPDGSYSRHAYLFDVTQVQVTAYNSPKKTVLEQLQKGFQKSGFSSVPKVMDTHKANGLSWTVYATKFNGEPIIMALAQTSTGRTLVQIMLVSAPERDAYYTGLFVPMLDALVPMW